MKPAVSIIMPSLNVAGYIDEAIASVRKQTIDDIEIICIDAGSTDGTRERIAKNAQEDTRIIVLDSPVKSYGHQVNMGLDIAKGEYVAILETDDYVDADMYGSLYELASKNGLDYAKCDYDTYSVDENGERLFAQRRVGRYRELYDAPFAPIEHPDVAFDDWYLWNGIYRAGFLKESNIRLSETPGAAFQDVGFLHRTTSAASSVRYLDRSLYRYCVSRPEASSNSDKTLKFIRQEYGILFDDIDKKVKTGKLREPEQPREYSLLYRRLAKSLTRSCMDASDDYLSCEDAKEMIGWLRYCLLEGTQGSYITKEMLPTGLQDTYSHLIPEDDLLVYRKKRDDDLCRFLDEGHPIVIFGCGIYGREAISHIRKLGYEVTAFMDNYERLWGKTVAGVVIKAPAMIPEMPDDTRFVIANENHSNEIRSQIATFVSKDRIKIY